MSTVNRHQNIIHADTRGTMSFTDLTLTQYVVRQYRDHRTMMRIARQTGYSETTIFRILKRAGEPTRPRGTKGTGLCVDCDAKCGRARRCPPHAAERKKELDHEAWLRWQETHQRCSTCKAPCGTADRCQTCRNRRTRRLNRNAKRRAKGRKSE